jgi:hypothetical protein
MVNPAFERYIGIDYSGAETPKSSLNGLCVYVADRLTAPREVEPPPSPVKFWTRRGIAEGLVEKLYLLFAAKVPRAAIRAFVRP